MMAYWFNPVTWIEIRGWKKWDDEWRSCDEKANKMILDSWRLRPFCFLLKLEWPRGTCEVKGLWLLIEWDWKELFEELERMEEKKNENLMNQVHLIFFNSCFDELRCPRGTQCICTCIEVSFGVFGKSTFDDFSFHKEEKKKKEKRKRKK